MGLGRHHRLGARHWPDRLSPDAAPELVEDVPEPESGEVESPPVEVLPETVVAEPVEAAPAFTG